MAYMAAILIRYIEEVADVFIWNFTTGRQELVDYPGFE
jgi:hypothetical protein